MPRSNPKSLVWLGARDGAPFMLVIVPFALLFGVVATEAGLNIAEVMGMSVLVIAGAAQFAALQQMVGDAPVLMVLATALAVNLRMAMYSASLTPYLGAAPLWKRAFASYLMVDQSYMLSIAKYETEPAMTLSERLRYYFGTMMLIGPMWYVASFVGAVVGKAIPPEFALDFAVPITFLAMIAPMLRTLAHVAAAATSVVVALVLAGLPYGAGLLVAAALAMAVGAGVEVAMQRART
ncbi:AzlC family ABC transporter permease [Maritimibacter sp. HL-12]|uniref:AzlC family ABC transporter permease n=1 Tax=Maritimibacter sp. HL-12 TaxID=1162418 RepID=UPI000A0F1B38|nr:AzlC family ABC transporter permease [Maritimibacter sp. HL-12]SMH40724.1 Predicted branched-chain amino acid permease (azaleucine resistance) [Maritimibacter sp. HL-12]